jgi:uncharacterized membrane protein YecN with MAPEG domain
MVACCSLGFTTSLKLNQGGAVSFAIYIIGFIILIGGLAYGASLAGLSTQWIVVGVLVLLGMGIAMGVTRTRQKDPPA